MSIRPGVDFPIAGRSEDYLAVVNVTDEDILVHRSDVRVKGSGRISFSPDRIMEDQRRDRPHAMIRFFPADHARKVQAEAPGKLRVLPADAAYEIAMKAEKYVETGMRIVNAIQAAYKEAFPFESLTTAETVASTLQRRERLLYELATTRGIELRDPDGAILAKYEHLTNDQLIELRDYPERKYEILRPRAVEPVDVEMEERKRLATYLRSKGKTVVGFPGLAKLKQQVADLEAEETAAVPS